MRTLSDMAQGMVDRLDQAACYSNLYRWTRFHWGEEQISLAPRWQRTQMKVDFLQGARVDLRFDDTRSPLARMRQLERTGDPLGPTVAALLCLPNEGYRRNLCVLHQAQRARRALTGGRCPDKAIRYMNRARRALDDDASFHSARAASAAAGVLMAHDALRQLLSQPHYRRSLYSRQIEKGGLLTNGQIAADATVASLLAAAICTGTGLTYWPVMACILGVTAYVYSMKAAYHLMRKHRSRRGAFAFMPSPPPASSPARPAIQMDAFANRFAMGDSQQKEKQNVKVAESV